MVSDAIWFFFFLLQKITLAISWGKGGSWELTRRLFRQPRKARNDGDNIEAPTTNAIRNLPKKKERNLPVGLFGVGIFPRALSQSHTQPPTHLCKAEIGISLDVFFPPSLTSHTTTNPISPRSFNLSLPHSLVTATTSVQAIRILPGLVTTVTSSSKTSEWSLQNVSVHGTSYVKPLTGSSLHTEEISETQTGASSFHCCPEDFLLLKY